MTPTRVWIDTDPAVGVPGRDVDDGLALLQALRSPELLVAGISTVFGNSDLGRVHASASEILPRAGAEGLGPHRGAAGADELGVTSAASEALGDALRAGPLTVLALGPLTNIATVLLRHPEVVTRINEVVFVGGRRPGQRFMMGRASGPAPDYNFECDPEAGRVVAGAAGVPLLLTGWEVGMTATIGEAQLRAMAAGPPVAAWLAEQAEGWLALRRSASGLDGFQPWDSLAISAVATPHLLDIEAVDVAVVDLGEEVEPTWRGVLPPTTLQLHAATNLPGGRPARYASAARPGYMEDLMRRLLAERSVR